MATNDDFNKLDLRIGRILAVEAITSSTKLLSISVDVGEHEPRTVLSGVAKVYKAEELIGKNVIVITNMDPKSMAGSESNGMILGLERDRDDLPCLLFTQDDIPPGCKVS